jgi:hypothetical protein
MNKISIAVVATVAFGLLATGPLFAQTTTLTMLGDPNGVEGPVMGGVYTSPYYATVGSNPSPVAVICDDFIDETYFSESWTAYVSSLSNLPSSPPQYSSGMVGGDLLNQSQAYTVAAYLAAEILQTNQSTSSGQEAAGDLSYALWGLFDPAVFTDQNNGLGGSCTLSFGCLSSGDLTAAENDLAGALTAVNTMNLNPSDFDAKMGVAGVTIYTYDASAGLPTGCSGTCPPPPQEFISVNMAEPPSPALLGADLLALAGFLIFARRRLARSVS